MRAVRSPAVAGTFYPSGAAELGQAVREYVAAALERGTVSPVSPGAKAVIAPHAGYVYSGPVAGSAFAALAPLRGCVTRVVLVGPAHRAYFEGLAVPQAEAFATPLGRVRVDAEAAAELLGSSPRVIASDRAHAGEHSIEVELPFLQEVLGDVAVVPIVIGDATDVETAHALERLWGGPETRVVVSSDLSHYLPYATARRMDERTACAIEELRPEDIGEDQACGCVGVRGLLRVARERGLHARRCDLRNSGDTAGPRDGVVGYGAFAFG
jgi:AmmeMemoRadiSam system protein B